MLSVSKMILNMQDLFTTVKDSEVSKLLQDPQSQNLELLLQVN